MDTNEAMKPATKGDIEAVKVDLRAEIKSVKGDLKAEIEDLAATTNKAFTKVEERFTKVEEKIDGVQGDVKLILSTIENLSGQISDAKQSTISARDHIRLEDPLEVVEEKLGIKA